MPTCIPLFKTNTRLYCCLFPSVLNFYRMKIYPRSQSRDWLALESSVENVKLLTGGRKSTTRTAAWYAILASILRYSILTRLTLSNLVSVSLWMESLRRAWQLKTTLIKMYIALSTGLLTLQSLPRSSFLLGERNDKKKKMYWNALSYYQLSLEANHISCAQDSAPSVKMDATSLSGAEKCAFSKIASISEVLGKGWWRDN